jgi:hypothetical protein
MSKNVIGLRSASYVLQGSPEQRKANSPSVDSTELIVHSFCNHSILKVGEPVEPPASPFELPAKKVGEPVESPAIKVPQLGGRACRGPAFNFELPASSYIGARACRGPAFSVTRDRFGELQIANSQKLTAKFYYINLFFKSIRSCKILIISISSFDIR